MEEILFGSIIVWVLGRIAKKKADAPAPGTIALPPQQRQQQRNTGMPQFDPQGNPGAPAYGQPVTGGPAGSNGSNGNTLKKFV
jgi:hypothetical protein